MNLINIWRANSLSFKGLAKKVNMALVTSVDLPMKRKCVPEAMNGNNVVELKVKKLSSSAKIPTRESADAAGYDLYRLEEHVLII